MKAPGVALVAIVAAGIGLAAGTMIGSRTPARSDRAPEEAGAIRAEKDREIAELRQKVHDLQAENAAVLKEADRVESEVADLRQRLGSPAPDASSPGESGTSNAAGSGAPEGFFLDRYNGAMRKVDWTSVGTSMGEMSRLIAAIVPSLERRETPDVEQVGRIRKLNTNLLAAAVLVQQDVPGSGVNGAFSNPAFMVNAMSSTLKAVGKPLTERQRNSILNITADWLAADEKRLASYDENSLTIRRLYEEAELKDGFFRDVFAELTPDQVEALSPAVSRDRVRLDLFSSALIYVSRVQPVPFEETKTVVDFLLERGLAGLRLTEEEKTPARDVVTRWLDGIPADLLFREANVLDLQGMVKSGRVTAWAKHEVNLLKRLAEAIPFNADRVRFARAAGGVAVPLKK